MIYDGLPKQFARIPLDANNFDFRLLFGYHAILFFKFASEHWLEEMEEAETDRDMIQCGGLAKLIHQYYSYEKF